MQQWQRVLQLSCEDCEAALGILDLLTSPNCLELGSSCQEKLFLRVLFCVLLLQSYHWKGGGTVAFMRDVVHDYLTRDCSVLPTNQSKELALSRGKTANVTTGFLQTSRLSTFETKIITSGSPLSTMDRSPMAHIGDRQYHFPIASTFSTFLCLLWDFGRNSGPSGHKLCIKIKTLI